MSTLNFKFKSGVFGAGFMSEREFAETVGDSPALVSRIAHGLDTTMKRKRLYCKFLGKSIDEIFPQERYPNRSV